MSDIDPITTVTPESGPPPGGAPVESGDRQPGRQPVQEPQPQRRSRAGTFFLGAFSACAIVFLRVFFISIIVADSRYDTPSDCRIAGAKVASVPMDGEIIESRDTVERIQRYGDSSTIRLIV